MRDSAIAVSGLRKAYGDKAVLDGIDFDVAAGTVFSMLGPNGAGKTTTVNVLTTLMKADGGTVRVAGHDVATETKAGARGDRGHRPVRRGGRSAHRRENLQLMADLHHLRAARASGWSPRCWSASTWRGRHRRWRSTYSGGMRRKLDLAMTLVDQAADHLPGRADDGTGPAQPPHDVEHRPRTGGRGHHRLPDHPVSRGGRSARRPDRGARPGPHGRRGHSRRAQAPGPRQPRPAPLRRRPATSTRPRRSCPASTRDDAGPDPAGAQRRQGEIAAGSAGPARRAFDRRRGVLRAHAGPR